MDPIEDKECDVIRDDDLEPCGDTLFQSEEEMRRCLSRLCFGDLYIIGSIWIELLKTVLVGSKFSLFPVVEAAKPPEPPSRPPKMKYKDLPIYQSPHYEYKDYIADKGGCANRNTKLIQKALYPRVQIWRKQWRDLCASVCCNIRHTVKDMKDSINSSKNDFKKTMRDPANLEMRQGVVAGGTVVGFFLGGGGGVPKRAFFTSLGALTAGALCFPKETDEVFREVSYRTAKTFLALYNGLCRKTYALRERVPCKDELKPDPPFRKPLDCPKKK